MNAYYVMPKSDPSMQPISCDAHGITVLADRMEVNGNVITLLGGGGVVFVTTVERVEYVRKG